MFSAQTKFESYRPDDTIRAYKITLKKGGEYRTVEQLGDGRLDATFRAERANPGWLMVIATEAGR